MSRREHIIKAVKGQLDTPRGWFTHGQMNPRMIRTVEECSPDQLRGVLKTIAPGCPVENIVVIVDASEGKGTKGLAFTEYGMYASKNMLKASGLFAKALPMPIRYEEIIQLEHYGAPGEYSNSFLLLPRSDGRKTTVLTGPYTQFLYDLHKHINWAMMSIREEEAAQKAQEIAQQASVVIAQGDKLAASGDLSGAVRCYTQAAEMNDGEGMYRCGQVYEEGLGVQQDQKAAFQWYYKAAGKKHPGAYLKVGEMYFEGRGTEADHFRGKDYYSSAAMAGHPEGLYRLGILTCQNPGYEDLGLSYLEKAAAKGHAKAAEKAQELRDEHEQTLAQAAAYYNAGDYAGTARCLESLVRRGVAQAEYQYGYLCWAGEGVPYNAERAFNLFKRAADSGHAAAMTACGYCYLGGIGVEEDRGAANKMLHKAAKLGDTRARLSLEKGNIFDPHTIFVIN